jgi:hypothetical protein
MEFEIGNPCHQLSWSEYFLHHYRTTYCLIWPSSAGWVTDLLVRCYAMRNDDQRKPQVRLEALGLAILIPITPSKVVASPGRIVTSTVEPRYKHPVDKHT